MEAIRNLVYILAVAFGISVLGGFFDWPVQPGFEVILGLVDVGCVVGLVYLVSKKQPKKNKK